MRSLLVWPSLILTVRLAAELPDVSVCKYLGGQGHDTETWGRRDPGTSSITATGRVAVQVFQIRVHVLFLGCWVRGLADVCYVVVGVHDSWRSSQVLFFVSFHCRTHSTESRLRPRGDSTPRIFMKRPACMPACLSDQCLGLAVMT